MTKKHKTETLGSSSEDNLTGLSPVYLDRKFDNESEIETFVSSINNSETKSEFKCNYCDNILRKGKNLEVHKIKNQKLPENSISCYVCDEENINDVQALGQYVVLWDKGVVGGGGEVYPECEFCITSSDWRRSLSRM